MSRRSLASASQFLAGRRQFLLSGASLAMLPWLGSIATGAVQRKPSFSHNPFPLGVASGDPTPDGVVLWTRLAPQPLAGGGLPPETYEVTWEVAEDDGLKRIVRQGKALATPQLGHSVHVELEGLKPDRWYWYRFSIADAQSPIARTRTTPAWEVTPEKLRFAFASCQHYESGLYTAYQHMAAEELDLVVHLGDYIYENGGRENRVRRHHGEEIISLDDYRNRHAQYKTDPLLQAAHARCPWLLVWDDHEVDNNYAGDISEKPQVSNAELLLRRANAYQAYYEHMPLRRNALPFGPNMNLYRSIPYGQLVDFSMLDTRQYRTDQPNDDRPGPLVGDFVDPSATLLGDKQEGWLMNTLLKSTAEWNVLGQQVMMARVDFGPGAEQKFGPDIWSGYDVARKRLLKFIAERKIPNPIVLTGDIHSNWVNDLKIDFDRGDDPTVATEFVGTSISSDGNGSREVKSVSDRLAENPFVRFFNAERGYVSCTVTPHTWRSDYQVVEYVDKPGAPLVTRKSFVVESGQPGAKTA